MGFLPWIEQSFDVVSQHADVIMKTGIGILTVLAIVTIGSILSPILRLLPTVFSLIGKAILFILSPIKSLLLKKIKLPKLPKLLNRQEKKYAIKYVADRISIPLMITLSAYGIGSAVWFFLVYLR